MCIFFYFWCKFYERKTNFQLDLPILRRSIAHIDCTAQHRITIFNFISIEFPFHQSKIAKLMSFDRLWCFLYIQITSTTHSHRWEDKNGEFIFFYSENLNSFFCLLQKHLAKKACLTLEQLNRKISHFSDKTNKTACRMSKNSLFA